MFFRFDNMHFLKILYSVLEHSYGYKQDEYKALVDPFKREYKQEIKRREHLSVPFIWAGQVVNSAIIIIFFLFACDMKS